MNALQWIRRPSDDTPPRRVAGFLGSFDPPHNGHAWIARHLLATHDRVILLLPSHHLHKRIDPPFNATLQQRGRMLEHLRNACPERIGIAIAPEVLYLQLAECLQCEFPLADIGFGMGDESRAKLEASGDWFARAGVPWGPEERLRLELLLARVVAFGRTNPAGDVVELPESIRAISSTAVRARVASLIVRESPWERWVEELEPLMPEPVLRIVYEEGLYLWF